jgi:OOP family OmpA-OmpF porin
MMITQRGLSFRWLLLCLALAVGAIGGGCGGVRPDPITLEQARTAYRQAEAESSVIQHAPVALRDAKQALDRAEQTWQAERDTAEVEHLSYLVEQRVAIARAKADNQVAEAERQRLAQEREALLREARTQEADQARREAAEARAQQAEAAKQIAVLQDQLQTLQAKATSRGTVFTLGNVLFATGQATLKSEALHHLYPLATMMRDEPERTAIIEGYTDNVGSDDANLDLSQRRADAVREFLLRNGVSSERVTARGFGEASPIASNDTPEGRQQNRRVEIVFPK